MGSSTQSIINAINLVRFNPSAIQRIQLDTLQGILGGTIDMVDASAPFPYLMEMASTVGAAAMTDNAVSVRKLYPSMSMTQEDLYLHMSDRDYIGNFASPGLTRVRLLLSKDEVIASVVPTGVGNVSQITIPRETYFNIGGLIFTMQYPVNIRVMGHGGLNITFDTSAVSPLQNLPTNQVTWQITNIGGINYIDMTFPVYQMQISTSYGSINASAGFSATYNYPDQYYFARVYVATGNNTWQEITTTYTQQVFDLTVPTALLTVLSNNQLQVDIPEIYLTTGQLTTELRVDIYTTKGNIDVDLSDYQVGTNSATWVDLDSSTNSSYVSPFVAPLSTLSTVLVASNTTVSGGSNALDFATLRSRVVADALGENSTPITNAQLGSTLSNLGFDAVADVDDVTNRIFQATRALPAPDPKVDKSISSGVGCAVMTLQASFNELITQKTVSNNGNRITIQPKTLYTAINGQISPVSDTTVASLLGLSQDALISAINAGDYVYSPFHYVLDINTNTFAARSYYLDAPSVTSRSFIEENDTLGMSVATGLYQLVRTYANTTTGDVDGYALYVITQSESVFEGLADNQITVQLAFIPEGEVDYAYVNGTFVTHCNEDGTVNPSGPERMYKFILSTNYDLDANDALCLTSFSMFANGPAHHFAPLSTNFQLIYAVSGVTIQGQTHSAIDNILNLTNLPTSTYGVTQEQFTLQLGYALNGLWNRCRTVVSSQDYARYTAPVPWTYAEDVYARDPVTGNILITNTNGVFSYQILHHAGDPVLDPNTGQPLIRFNIGDVIVDGSGNPTVITTRNTLRQVDMVFLDGLYWFATSAVSQQYIATIPQIIYGWLSNDLATVTPSLLEQTQLFLLPKATMGQVSGQVVAGTPVTIPALQSFTVDYYLTGVGYRNADLRASLTSLTGETLAAAVSASQISVNDIEDTLTAAAGSDVIALKVSGLGGKANDFTTFQVADDSIRLAVGKIATAAPDGTIAIQDNITINFYQSTAN